MNLDRRTWVAIALCAMLFLLYRPILHRLGYGRYLAPAPTPVSTQDMARRDTAGTAARALSGGTPAGPQESGIQAPATAAAAATAPVASLFATPAAESKQHLEKSFQLETPLYRATFASSGARLVAVELKHYAVARGSSGAARRPARGSAGAAIPSEDRVVLAGGPLVALDLGARSDLRTLAAVAYAATESLNAAGEAVALTFTARDSSGAFIRQTYRVRPDTYALDLEVELRGVPGGWRLSDYSLSMQSWPLVTESDEVQDARGLRATSVVGTNLRRDNAGGLVGKTRASDGNARWAGVQSRYFVVAAALTEGNARGVVSAATRRPLTTDERRRLPANSARAQMEVVANALVVSLPSDLKPVNRFVLYVGPTEYSRLAAIKLGFERAVDLGWPWLEPFSKVLLFLLKWLQGLVLNYGVAIILLATIVRLLLHPLNMVSMRSMRAMQRLQPEIERLREKHKGDAQALNTATMALYKDNKVNPASGCLPMLLQIPIFIALYQVLFNAIELRQAPFVGWMTDLSAPDLLFTLGPLKLSGMTLGPLPIRLLPVLMAATGIASQRLTPSDPRQLPTMYMMNAVMLIFFYGLPSGLVLYWTLMNVLTAVQQWLVLRQDGGAAPPAAAPAGVPAVKRKAARR